MTAVGGRDQPGSVWSDGVDPARPSARRACVIGWPIKHSRSPTIHGHWLARYGIEGSYGKIAVPPEEVRAFLAGLAASGYAGCNVTVPHKEAAFAAAEERDASALAVGAANTLWLDEGRLCAANTDTVGYMTYLAAVAPRWAARDAPVLVLGAGGAARAIVYGFLDAGVGRVVVTNRSRERADALASAFGARVHVLDWADRSYGAAGAGVIVNTTSLGLNGIGDPGLDIASAQPDTVVSDVVYTPLETAFLAGARARGLTTVDGLGMLLHQAVPGFERWFGIRPAVTPELYALVAADITGDASPPPAGTGLPAGGGCGTR